MGWSFSFHTDPGLPRSFAAWKERLKTGEIVDEYGERVTLAEFVALVERKKDGKRHADLHPEDSYLDPEGHSFSEGEFS